MAFSTQKEYIHVAYMNERLSPKCINNEGVDLKTYASSPDERAWSPSRDKQAQYLIDLVACRMYPRESKDFRNEIEKCHARCKMNKFTLLEDP